MCIIIDANVANEFATGSENATPVLVRLTKGKLKLVAGGKLKVEWQRTKLGRLYQQLLLSGTLVEYSERQTEEALATIRSEDLRSDDPHVLALARASGARILFSRDERLHDDFKNRRILPGEKGKIYQCKDHVHVLDEGACACH